MKATVELGKTLERQPTRGSWLAAPRRYLEKEWFLGYALIAPAGILDSRAGGVSLPGGAGFCLER